MPYDLQRLWYFPKTSGLEGGETCQSWPFCYDFKWGEITARGDWVWAVYAMSLINRYYIKDPIDGMWVRGLPSSGLADMIRNLNLRRSVTDFSIISVLGMIYCSWDSSLTGSMGLNPSHILVGNQCSVIGCACCVSWPKPRNYVIAHITRIKPEIKLQYTHCPFA